MVRKNSEERREEEEERKKHLGGLVRYAAVATPATITGKLKLILTSNILSLSLSLCCLSLSRVRLFVCSLFPSKELIQRK
jgi:hypothetical protein